ncbi:MAG: Putative ribonucleoprotein related-protein TROVE Domain, partial [uncultured Phycisphaerae bacterium]
GEQDAFQVEPGSARAGGGHRERGGRPRVHDAAEADARPVRRHRLPEPHVLRVGRRAARHRPAAVPRDRAGVHRQDGRVRAVEGLHEGPARAAVRRADHARRVGRGPGAAPGDVRPRDRRRPHAAQLRAGDPVRRGRTQEPRLAAEAARAGVDRPPGRRGPVPRLGRQRPVAGRRDPDGSPEAGGPGPGRPVRLPARPAARRGPAAGGRAALRVVQGPRVEPRARRPVPDADEPAAAGGRLEADRAARAVADDAHEPEHVRPARRVRRRGADAARRRPPAQPGADRQGEGLPVPAHGRLRPGGRRGAGDRPRGASGRDGGRDRERAEGRGRRVRVPGRLGVDALAGHRPPPGRDERRAVRGRGGPGRGVGAAAEPGRGGHPVRDGRRERPAEPARQRDDQREEARVAERRRHELLGAAAGAQPPEGGRRPADLRLGQRVVGRHAAARVRRQSRDGDDEGVDGLQAAEPARQARLHRHPAVRHRAGDRARGRAQHRRLLRPRLRRDRGVRQRHAQPRPLGRRDRGRRNL